MGTLIIVDACTLFLTNQCLCVGMASAVDMVILAQTPGC